MTEQEKIKKWVRTWQQADSALNEIKKAELQDEDYYKKNFDLLCSMLQYAYDHREERQTSGLFVQQQLFNKLAQSRVD